MKATIYLAALLALGCEDFFHPEKRHREQEQYEWERACRDESQLLATTSGSPSVFVCNNKRHRMRFQVASAPSNEEGVALVVCECERDGGSTR